MDTILVTGATGNVGREVVKGLLARGTRVRVSVTDEADTRRAPSGVAEVALFDFTAPETFPAAFDGVARLFLVRPPAIGNVKRDMKPAIDYAVAAGVGHVVFLSLVGAERNRLVPHAKVEKPVSYTHLDVYKRQPANCAPSATATKFWSGAALSAIFSFLTVVMPLMAS